MTRERFMDYVAEYLGVEKYEEFKMGSEKYRVTDESIEFSSKKSGWIESFNRLSSFKKENVVKLPWKPKLYETYWFIDITNEDGVDNFIYYNDLTDKSVLKRGEVFKIKEQALERVKELGW